MNIVRHFRTYLVALCLGLTCFAAPVVLSADETAPTDSTTVNPGGRRTGPASTAAPEAVAKNAVVQKIIEVVRGREMPDRIIDTYFEKLKSAKGESREELSVPVEELLLPPTVPLDVRKRMHTSMFSPEKIDQTRAYVRKLEIAKFNAVVLKHLLSKNYTTEELEQLLAFCQSPVGRKTIELFPSMAEDVVDLGQQYFPAQLDDIQEDMRKTFGEPDWEPVPDRKPKGKK